MRFGKRVTSAILGSILLLTLGALSPVSAAATTSTNTMEISPLRSDITVNPGNSTVVTVSVINNSSVQEIVTPIENDFVAGSKENGTPAIILDQNKYAPTHSLKRFMSKLPSTLTVPANGKASVDLTITVPAKAQAGGYFGAVRFEPASQGGNNQVNLVTSAASLILLNVPGPTVENLNMTDFDIQQDGNTATSFHSPTGLSVLIRFQNTGNVQEAPFGQIYVQKGNKVLYKYNFNQENPKGEILPDSARRWSVPIKGLGKFGKYTITGDFTYGVDKTQSVTVTKTVWIIPSSLIFGVIGGLILLALIITAVVMGLRSYKRKIMRQARRYR